MAEKIERRALARQDAPRRAFDDGDARARLDRRAVGALDAKDDARIDQLKGQRGKIEARDDAGLTRDQRGLRLGALRARPPSS